MVTSRNVILPMLPRRMCGHYAVYSFSLVLTSLVEGRLRVEGTAIELPANEHCHGIKEISQEYMQN